MTLNVMLVEIDKNKLEMWNNQCICATGPVFHIKHLETLALSIRMYCKTVIDYYISIN